MVTLHYVWNQLEHNLSTGIQPQDGLDCFEEKKPNKLFELAHKHVMIWLNSFEN